MARAARISSIAVGWVYGCFSSGRWSAVHPWHPAPLKPHAALCSLHTHLNLLADNPEAAWNWRIGGASAFDELEEVAVSGGAKAADDDAFLSSVAAGLELHDELSLEQKDLMRVVLEQVRFERFGLSIRGCVCCIRASCTMRTEGCACIGSRKT
jgi:hypothetical protein